MNIGETKNHQYLLLTMLFLLISVTPAWAIAGRSMLFITAPWMLLAGFPIFLLEGWIIRHRLKLTLGQAMATSGVNTFISTLFGVPLTWYLLYLIQINFGGTTLYGLETLWYKIIAVTLEAPVLPPYEADQRWMIPAAVTYLMIMYGIASFLIDCLIGMWLLRQFPVRKRIGALFLANLASTSVMTLYGLIPLVIEANKRFG